MSAAAVNGSQRSTTFSSKTKLTASISAADIATARNSFRDGGERHARRRHVERKGLYD
jgi:hypothetical protein